MILRLILKWYAILENFFLILSQMCHFKWNLGKCLISIKLIFLRMNHISDGSFRGCSRMMGGGGGGRKKAPVPKICHTYPTMMKLQTHIPYLKKIQKIYKSYDTLLTSADSNFLPKISNFCYIEKHKYRLYFDTIFLIFLTIF